MDSPRLSADADFPGSGRGFAVKVPLVPLHTWLPLAHVQAPTGGSIDLAGILLKLGTYGILRFCLPMLPDATAMCMPGCMWLAVIGIIYGALVSLVQSDMKKLVAYSSVSHMGFVILGFFALNQLSLQGGILQMINHGLSSAGLFAIVGMIYERYHTRQISELGGLAKRTPLLATFMVLFAMSSIGLPGMNGFVGEFMILLGMFQRAWADAPGPLGPQLIVIAVLAVSGVVLGAWYMLWMIQTRVLRPAERGSHFSRPCRTNSRFAIQRNAGSGPAVGLHLLDRHLPQIVFETNPARGDRDSRPDHRTAARILRVQPQPNNPGVRDRESGVSEEIAANLHQTPGTGHHLTLFAMTDSNTIYLLLPEIILVAAATLLYVVGAFVSLRKAGTWAAIGAMALAAAVMYGQDNGLGLFSQSDSTIAKESGPLAVDLFGHTVRWGVLVVGLMLILMLARAKDRNSGANKRAPSC